ncbi:MAG: NAD(P)H-dependent glycerol-3-phosphate dehydrogenase [Tissierellia bacterium]|nr:NAD(P)H-dependent glycerol-3-phosphate dehydrogenase [Tissierellia bacterium]
MNISVVGGGSWGISLANVLVDNGHNVTMYLRDKEQCEYIQKEGHSPKYLKDFVFPQTLQLKTSLEDAIVNAEMILMVVPLQQLQDVLQKMTPFVTKKMILVNASKGIHFKTLKTASELVEDILPGQPYAVLSGPSHAEEVSKRLLTSVVSCSSDVEIAKVVQDAFMNDYFRVYVHTDVRGVEIAGALKNVVAIASGLLSGLEQGDNARAALISRGLFEIFKLAKKMGCDMQTFMGLAGVGDLIVTATSVHSRNYRAGILLGKGCSVEELEKEIGMVVEGIMTTQSAHTLAKMHGVEMPITNALYAVLFEGKNPEKAVMELMKRSKKHEFLEKMEL